MLNLVSILIAIFEHLGCLFGSLLALFWEPLGRLGGSLVRHVGAKGGPKRVPKEVLAPKSLQVASGTSFGGLWDPSWDAFWEVLGGSWGAKWEPKGFNKGAKRDVSDEIAPSRM